LEVRVTTKDMEVLEELSSSMDKLKEAFIMDLLMEEKEVKNIKVQNALWVLKERFTGKSMICCI
jgi:hypothetical protein